MPSHTKTADRGPILLNRERHFDQRGWFEELSIPELDPAFAGLEENWTQWNISHSIKDVLRGLHYQAAPHQQAKLIRVVDGKIWDVVVDLRQHSSTYRNWQAFELSADQPQSLYIPEGFAHGFLTLSDTATVIYTVSRPRCIESERVIRWDDPKLGISWPVKSPILSERDA